MELVQARLVTEDVAGLAAFYAGLVGAKVPVNEYYVEVPAGPPRPGGEVILDFMVGDADAEYGRIEALGVDWVLRPATQPWGSRAMVFKDPEGRLVNVFSRP